MFQGSIVAIVTPMQKDGSIDKKSLFDLIEWHIASNTQGLVVAGTTGESVTLSGAEHADLIKSVVKQVNKRIPVIAGSGSNSTQHSLELTSSAKNAGADACLIVTPYYNKPTQDGLFEHYKLIADNCAIPFILYNVPSRTCCDLLPETVARLAAIPNIIGIKEATGLLSRVSEISKLCGKDFLIFSGDDATAKDLMLLGANGTISVTANVAPSKMYDLCKVATSGNKEMANQLDEELRLLHKNLFLEANPIPTKWALSEMGMIPQGIRLPLLPLNPKFHNEVREALRSAGVFDSTKV